MKLRSYPSLVFVLACLLVIPACIMVIDPERLTEQEPETQFSRTLDFQAGGNLAITNDFGRIRISGGDEDKLDIRSSWRLRRPVRSRISFYGVGTVRPDIKIDRQDDLVKIQAEASKWPGTPFEVDFELITPVSVNLQEVDVGRGEIEVSDLYGNAVIKLGTGNVTVTNFSGSLDIKIEKGAAFVEALDIRGGDLIRIDIDGGDIELMIEEGAGALVEAAAAEGEVYSEFKLVAGESGRSLSGMIGTGQARIILATRHGNIKIGKIKE